MLSGRPKGRSNLTSLGCVHAAVAGCMRLCPKKLFQTGPQDWRCPKAFPSPTLPGSPCLQSKKRSAGGHSARAVPTTGTDGDGAHDTSAANGVWAHQAKRQRTGVDNRLPLRREDADFVERLASPLRHVAAQGGRACKAAMQELNAVAAPSLNPQQQSARQQQRQEQQTAAAPAPPLPLAAATTTATHGGSTAAAAHGGSSCKDGGGRTSGRHGAPACTDACWLPLPF